MEKRSRMSNAVLPCEIIHENILTRLPVKSLLRFRCVCKSWCELIRTPRFVKMHSDQYKNDPKLMLVSMINDVYSLEYGEKHHIDVVKVPFSGFQFHRILGSCNGLVFVTNNEKRQMYLWNPSTREYKFVPTFPQEYEFMSNRHGSGYISGSERYPTSSTYGFGYNASAKDYEIIMISAYCSYEPYFSQYSIYSLRKNSWRGFQDMSPYVVESLAMGELVNDALHWVGVGHNKSRSVIAFDIEDKKFRELPLPPASEGRSLAICTSIKNGSLSIRIYYRFSVEIWMMKDYGVKESWTKVINFSRPGPGPGLRSNPYSSVLKCFAMNNSTQNMGFHDMTTCTLEGLLRKLGGGNEKAEQLIANSLSATFYTETLVQLQGFDYV